MTIFHYYKSNIFPYLQRRMNLDRVNIYHMYARYFNSAFLIWNQMRKCCYSAYLYFCRISSDNSYLDPVNSFTLQKKNVIVNTASQYEKRECSCHHNSALSSAFRGVIQIVCDWLVVSVGMAGSLGLCWWSIQDSKGW